MTAFAGALPRVSVAMITYNHAAFIAQAIESVLAQETPFAIELIIGEDGSTDDTRGIVQRYAAARPDVIRPLLHQRNLGMHGNHRAVLAACRGEFVAYLEGDDLWRSPRKLATQVALLTARTNAVGCFHRVDIIDVNGRSTGRVAPATELPEQTTGTLLRANYMSTPSIMVRRRALPLLTARFDHLRMCDWPTWVFASLQGSFVFLPDTLGAYREHSAGAWTGAAAQARTTGTIALFRALSEELPEPHAAQARRQLALRMFAAAEDAALSQDCAGAKHWLGEFLRLGSELHAVSLRRLISLCARVRLPRLYAWLGFGLRRPAAHAVTKDA